MPVLPVNAAWPGTDSGAHMTRRLATRMLSQIVRVSEADISMEGHIDLLVALSDRPALEDAGARAT